MNYVKPVDYYDRMADALEIISGDSSHIDEESKTMDYYDRMADALENIANFNIKKQSLHLMANIQADSTNEQYLVRTFIDQPLVNMCALTGAAFKSDDNKIVVTYLLYVNELQKTVASWKVTRLISKSWEEGDYNPATDGLLTLDNAPSISSTTPDHVNNKPWYTWTVTSIIGSTEANEYVYYRPILEITYTDGSLEKIYGTQVKITRLEDNKIKTAIYNNQLIENSNPNNITCIGWSYMRSRDPIIEKSEPFYSLIWDNVTTADVSDKFMTLKPTDFYNSNNQKISFAQFVIFSDNTQIYYNTISDPGVL